LLATALFLLVALFGCRASQYEPADAPAVTTTIAEQYSEDEYDDEYPDEPATTLAPPLPLTITTTERRTFTTAAPTRATTTAVATTTRPPGHVAVRGVSLQTGAFGVYPGQTRQLVWTVTPENASNTAVRFTSSNSSVATVSASGLVRAIAPGTANIAITTTDPHSQSVRAALIVTVHHRIVEISIHGTGTAAAGETSALGVQDDRGATVPHSAILWESRNPNVATVSASGVVSGIAPGVTVITASLHDNPEITADVGFLVTEQLVTEQEDLL